MMPWYLNCGGPLFSRQCLGSCRGSRRNGQPKKKGPSMADHVFSRWRAEFTSQRGMPLAVAVWRLYRVIMPQGHSIKVERIGNASIG
jgi:hypothetical protein